MLFGMAFEKDHRIRVQSKEPDIHVMLGFLNGPKLTPIHSVYAAASTERLTAMGNSYLHFFRTDSSLNLDSKISCGSGKKADLLRTVELRESCLST